MIYDPDYDWHDDYETELRRKPRPFACSDGLCGQLDCARCHPENFEDGRLKHEQD